MKHYHYKSITSTNDIAKDLLSKDTHVFVTADFQTEGRGRNNKNWLGEPKENIYCSLGISHEEIVSIENIVSFQAIGSIAARHAMTEAIGKNIFHLKYPNDIMVKMDDGSVKKICGVLAENGFIGSHCNYTIIGIGINVNQTVFQPEIAELATSLKLLGYNIKKETLIDLMVYYLQDLLKLNTKALFNIWKDELHIEGKEVTIVGDTGIWIVEKMLDDGRLLLININTQQQKVIDDGNSIRYEL